MRTRVSSVRQARCNFCLNWILIQRQVENSLYICIQCLTKNQNGSLVNDENGETHNIFFVKNDHLQDKRSLIFGNDASLKQSETIFWPQVQSLMEANSLTSEQRQLIESRISLINREYEQEAENIIDLIKEFSKFKSSISTDRQERDHHTSAFSSTAQRGYDIAQSATWCDDERVYRTDEFSSNQVSCARRIRNYDFYYNPSEIKSFKRIEKKQPEERYFGNELPTNANQDELPLKLRRHSQFHDKSKESMQSLSNRSGRLKQEALKSRIQSYLYTRYSSISLQRILTANIRQAYQQTNINNKTIDLVSFRISQIDLLCYLSLFDSDALTTIKFINVALRDHHLALILDWIKDKRVECLVLTGNGLTDGCLQLLLRGRLPFLKEIYLGKNRINRYRSKENIAAIRTKFMLYI